MICDGDERTEICDLESGAVRLTEKVLGLDIAVEETVFVHEREALDNLVHSARARESVRFSGAAWRERRRGSAHIFRILDSGKWRSRFFISS